MMIKKIEKLMIDILFLQICRFEFEKSFSQTQNYEIARKSRIWMI